MLLVGAAKFTEFRQVMAVLDPLPCHVLGVVIEAVLHLTWLVNGFCRTFLDLRMLLRLCLAPAQSFDLFF